MHGQTSEERADTQTSMDSENDSELSGVMKGGSVCLKPLRVLHPSAET